MIGRVIMPEAVLNLSVTRSKRQKTSVDLGNLCVGDWS